MGRTVVKGVIALGSANVLSQIITWTFTILVARLLKPEDYGLVSMVAVYIGFAEYFNEFGIGSAIVQKKDITRAQLRAIYTVSLWLGLFFTTISLPVGHLLARFFHEPRLVQIVYVAAPTFLITATKSVQMNMMMKEMRFGQIAKIELIAKVGSSFITYLCALLGFGYWTLIIMYLSYNLFQALLYSWHVRILPGRIESFQQIKGLLSFGGRVMLARVTGFIANQIDRVIIGRVIGVQTLGVYSLALTLGNKPVDKILTILNQVFFPLLSKAQDDTEQLRRYFLKIVEMELFLLLPIFVLLFFMADDFLPFLLGNQWHGAVLPFKVFMVIGVFIYLRNRLSVLVMSIGNPEYTIYCNVVVFFVMGAAMLILGYFFRVSGILATWLIFFPMIYLGFLSFVAKLLTIKVSSLFKCCRLPVTLALMTSMALSWLVSIVPFTGIRRALIVLPAGAVIYLLLFVLLDRKKFYEILVLLKLKKRKLR